MEQGEEFFAPATTKPRRSQRPQRSSRKDTSRGAATAGSGVHESRRRNFTAPSFARNMGLQALEEVDYEEEEEEEEGCQHAQRPSGGGSARTSSGGSTVCSRVAGCKTVAELAHEWDMRQQEAMEGRDIA
ncbi:hypothetical protein LPJ75_002599 [Coemansia sp. RSA 2598]|nr:hypothetical protein LPJ75_002599 [Coemansia sp. RSA 2598]